MKIEHTITPSCKRCADGWAPVLAYANGGRVIGVQRFGTKESAEAEAIEMITCMKHYPLAFADNHPEENQCIDLSQ